MRSRSTARVLAAAISAGALVLAGAGSVNAVTKPKPVTSNFKVGVITCKTGAFAAYGDAYLAGWQAGLDYITKSTGKVGKRKIEVLGIVDDKTTDVAGATAAFKDFVARGAKAIIGTCNSSMAMALAPLAAANKVIYISGPAALDDLSGVNRYTFRSGRQSQQDVKGALAYLKNTSGEKIITFAEDYSFGYGNASAVQYFLQGKGTTVLDPVMVPITTKDVTTYAKRVKDAKADFTFVAFAGFVNPWIAMAQQGVAQATTIITGMANYATFDLIGSVGGANFKYISSYFGGAGKNKIDDYMLASLEKQGKRADLMNPEGFNAALMVARLSQADNTGKDGVARLIKSLEGYKFNSVKGAMQVRAIDHALIQPMFLCNLVKGADGHFGPVWTKTVEAVAPALRPMQG